MSLNKSKFYVKLATVVTLFVAMSACAQNRVKPEELSKEVPQSAFNEDNWDTYRSDSQYETRPKTFRDRVKSKKRSRTSVAGY